MDKYFFDTDINIESLLELCMKLIGTEFTAVYCFDGESYFLVRFLYKEKKEFDIENKKGEDKEKQNKELICNSFEFPEEKILTPSEIEVSFLAKNFTIQNIAVVPIKHEKEKLGLLITGNKTSDLSFEKKDLETIRPVKILLKSVLMAEKYQYLYENKLSLGNTEFSRDLLLVNMSHEIRTPLNGIIGYNQLLSQTSLDEVQKKYLSSMNFCCLQLMQIVNDVLDYSKLITKKMLLSKECFLVQDLYNSIKNIMEVQLKSKKQVLDLSIDPNVPEYIYADKTKIIQILLNLVSNAHKFSKEESKVILSVKEYKKETLLFEIKDNGAGISEKDQTKLFHVFTQLKNNTVKVGTGLGLAICKKLVELMGGTIWVKSEENKGTSFYFTIKYEKCEDIENIIFDNLNLVEGKHVLVVDDNSSNRMLLTDLLFEWGMYPISCASGIEAVRLIVNHRYPFYIGLIDICMVDMNGIELAKIIRNENPDLHLIALSSLERTFDDEDFEYILEKPIHKLKLFNCILKIISGEDSKTFFLSDTEDCMKPVMENIRHFKNSRILLVEDIGYNLTMLVNMLTSLGYKNVDTSYDGADAIKKIDESYISSNPYKIILLDLKMSGINGYDVALHIKEKKYDCKIVAISASVLEYEKINCLEAGIKYFVPKPIQIKHLRSILKYLSKK